MRLFLAMAILAILFPAIAAAQDTQEFRGQKNLASVIQDLQKENAELRTQIEDLKMMIAKAGISQDVKAMNSPDHDPEAFVVIDPRIGQPVIERNAYVFDQFGRKHVWRANGRLVPVDVYYNHAPQKTMEIYRGSERTIQPVTDQTGYRGSNFEASNSSQGSGGATININ